MGDSIDPKTITGLFKDVPQDYDSKSRSSSGASLECAPTADGDEKGRSPDESAEKSSGTNDQTLYPVKNKNKQNNEVASIATQVNKVEKAIRKDISELDQKVEQAIRKGISELDQKVAEIKTMLDAFVKGEEERQKEKFTRRTSLMPDLPVPEGQGTQRRSCLKERRTSLLGAAPQKEANLQLQILEGQEEQSEPEEESESESDKDSDDSSPQRKNGSSRRDRGSLRVGLQSYGSFISSGGGRHSMGSVGSYASDQSYLQKARHFSFVIHPFGRLRSIWDMFIVIFVVYSAMSVPLEVSFGFDTNDVSAAWHVITLCVDTFFLMDIILNFCTGFLEGDTVIMVPSSIARHYFFGWFFPDLSGCMYFILEEIVGIELGLSGRFLRLCRFVRVLKLWRSLRLNQDAFSAKIRILFEEHVMVNEHSVMVWEFILVGIRIVLSCHYVACIWFAVPMYSFCYASDMPVLNMCIEDTWFLLEGLQDSGMGDRYLTSLYSAMMMIVGDNVTPTNRAEYLCAVSFCVVGIGLMTMIQAKLTAVATQWGAKKQELRKSLLESLRYLRKMGVAPELQRKVRDYVEFQFEQDTDMQMSPALLAMLSAPLRSEVISQSIGPVLRRCALFQRCPEEFIRALCMACTHETAGAGDRIIEQGTVMETAYFIIKGTVVMRTKIVSESEGLESLAAGAFAVATHTDEPEEQDACEMKPGQFFGELGLIHAGMTHWCSIDCKTHSQFIVLPKVGLQNAMVRYPDISERLERIWFREPVECWILPPITAAGGGGRRGTEICESGESVNENFSKELCNRFVLWQGNLCDLRVNALVNEANETLLGGSGIDGAIHAAAGPELREYCRRLGGCRPGTARATPSFDLAEVDYIFHTVGPSKEDAKVLASCYSSCLELAVGNGVATIAFSFICSDNQQYPKEHAAKVAVNTVAKWMAANAAALEKSDDPDEHLGMTKETTMGKRQSNFFAVQSSGGAVTKVPSSKNNRQSNVFSNVFVEESDGHRKSLERKSKASVHMTEGSLVDTLNRMGDRMMGATRSQKFAKNSPTPNSGQSHKLNAIFDKTSSSATSAEDPHLSTTLKPKKQQGEKQHQIERVIFVVANDEDREIFAKVIRQYFFGDVAEEVDLLGAESSVGNERSNPNMMRDERRVSWNPFARGGQDAVRKASSSGNDAQVKTPSGNPLFPARQEGRRASWNPLTWNRGQSQFLDMTNKMSSAALQAPPAKSVEKQASSNRLQIDHTPSYQLKY